MDDLTVDLRNQALSHLEMARKSHNREEDGVFHLLYSIAVSNLALLQQGSRVEDEIRQAIKEGRETRRSTVAAIQHSSGDWPNMGGD